jgi:hypothetical protein
MDLVDEIKTVSEGVIELNPTSIFIVSIIGLIATLTFIFIFRERLQESYGKRIYLWFLFLICLNIINIVFMTWYYNKKQNNIIGDRGPRGNRGKIGKKGSNVVCSLCSTEEIGIQYSDNYNLVGRINKTTNVIGQVSLWRGAGMLGLCALGDTIFTHKDSNKSRTYLAGYGSKPPTDFKKLIEISDGITIITLWEPIPPKDYSFLGHFAMVGQKKPDPANVACLPTGCLSSSSPLLYVASFPSIDIIPSNSANRNLKFCSFWRTPLNHFYCKPSDNNNYTTNSLYYNLVEGSPEYYDNQRKEPIPEKYDEIINILKDKVSVIYHAPRGREKEFNTIFIENIRNDKGRITTIQIHGSTYNKLLKNTSSFEKYLAFFRNSITYVDKLKEDNPKIVKFITDEKNTNRKNGFTGLIKQLENNSVDSFKKFVGVFEKNPQTAMKLFQDPTNSFGINTKMYDDMTVAERKSSFEILINKLNKAEIDAVLTKLNSVGIDDQPDQDKLFDILNSKEKSKIANAYATEEEVDPSLTLYDDLFYLFSRGLDDQIAASEEDAIEGGYYLLDVENRQRKNFFDYIKTFVKPNLPTYAFRKKCMMFVDVDKDRNEIINNLIQVYDLISNELDDVNRLDKCDNQEVLGKYYTYMMQRVDNQFKSIENYNEKIKDREFSYFPTSRLKWLLNEMTKYYQKIKENCNSDDRVKTISQIKTYRDQLLSDFNKSVDFNNYNLKFKDKRRKLIDINFKINNSDFDSFNLEQLKKILQIITDYYEAKVKESKDAKNKLLNNKKLSNNTPTDTDVNNNILNSKDKKKEKHLIDINVTDIIGNKTLKDNKILRDISGVTELQRDIDSYDNFREPKMRKSSIATDVDYYIKKKPEHK